MLIRRGTPNALTRAKGWKSKKVWKKTNQWYYCGACLTLWFFRVFKCRFDWTVPPRCECGVELVKAPERLCADAKILYPHFKPRDSAESWYYGVYLRSRTWQEIRTRVLARDGGKCRRCSMPASAVHHTSYDEATMAGNNDAALVSLCFDCHQFIEFDGERKTTLAEANMRLTT